MKRLLAAIAATVALAAAASAGEQILAVCDPWPPYQIGVEGQEAEGGLFVDRAKEIFSSLGVDAKIMLYPWRRAVRMVTEGTADVIIGLTQTQERLAFLAFATEPLGEIDVTVWYDPTQTQEPRAEDALQGAMVSVAAGYNYGPKWVELIRKYDVTVDQSPNDKTGLRKVVLGRIPYHVCYSDACREEVLTNSFPSADILMEATWVIDRLSFYIAASRKSEKGMKLIEELNKR